MVGVGQLREDKLQKTIPGGLRVGMSIYIQGVASRSGDLVEWIKGRMIQNGRTGKEVKGLGAGRRQPCKVL